jgi:RimJ/RimL family protein N-acetyltransferase
VSEVRLRPATPDDARDVWLWRNDPLTRAMSRTSEETPWESHHAWFEQALADPARTLLIGEGPEGKVGMVRFDRGRETEVSINVNPAVRGRGYGHALLAAAMATVQGDVVAGIREENVASQRLFERVGFRLESSDRAMRRYRFRSP